MSNWHHRLDPPLWISPTHGPQWIPQKYARLGPIDPNRRNPQAQRAREWIAEYEFWQQVEEIEISKSVFRAFVKELFRG